MFNFNLNDPSSTEENQIARDIELAGSELTISMSVRDQYEASSKNALAANWLKSWYIAETLAKHASRCDCEFGEGENGAGDFHFHFMVEDVAGVAKALVIIPSNQKLALTPSSRSLNLTWGDNHQSISRVCTRF